MPRKHKNKSHGRLKRHQVWRDTQEAQASAAAAPKEECPSSPSSAPQGSPLSSPAAGDRQELQGAMAPSSPDAGPSCAGSDEGAQGPEEESAGASQAAPATQSTRKDPLARKARILVEFLLEKYTKKEPITQNALMKIVSRKYRQHFPEILSTACERLELVFGLEMKEIDRSRNIYTLISKLNLGGNDCPSGEGGLPKSGLLMVLLGVIFMNGNRATEEEIWEFLSMLGIYAGRKHWIFGEPRRLITKDLVQKEYLNYRQVPNSDPPRYEFLWGPRACAETSKMKKALATGQLIQPVESMDSDMLPEVKSYGPGRIDIAGRLFAQFYKNLPTSVYNLSHFNCWCPCLLSSCLYSFLLSLTMPRSKKSQARGGDKCPQAQGQTQSCGGAQAIAAAEEESTTSSLQCEDTTQSLPGAESCSTSQEPQRIPTIAAAAVFSYTRSSEAFDGQYKYRALAYEVPPFTETPGTVCLTRKASLLEQFLLYKYKMKQLMMKEDMLKIIHQSHHDRFAEILKRASERIELVFAVELKEVDSVVPCYNLVSKLKLPNNGRVRGGRGLPKTGLLMNLLGMIFLKGNCAAEEDIWKYLGTMRVYAGRKHLIYGEPRKLITKDLVRLKYLEYRQVANSDPPRYEFLWGPKAHLETSKMKVLEFLAKVNDAVPSDFPAYYEEALRDEEEKAQGMHAARPDTTVKASPPSSPATGDHQELQGAMAPSSPDAEASCAGSDEGAQDPEEESAGASQAASATQSLLIDPLTRKASMLVEFLLEIYTKKELISQHALLKVVGRKYRQYFPEILSRASERMELVFGLELMEVDRSRNIYALINKLNLGDDEGLSDEKCLPKSGFLTVLLGNIFMKGKLTTGEEVWEFLSMLGIYAGRRHWIFGEPRRLITKDLVQKKYLKYRQVPNGDPLHYEFLWGPRACVETNKMKVLEVLGKIHDTVPTSFPDLYDEALRDQSERAGLRGAARAPTMTEACAPSRAKSNSSSHI
ncbi:hypothetical protein MG293_005876 [Ovis ammon polii]|uniref:MAGE domain-containing protein n=1 Tax=Ovis ammon polii TaxID=230172 RepID=A0AAD4UKC4_OVIAM|nr:hypothetical protein MG293_005876 [Ovis ammon polii]